MAEEEFEERTGSWDENPERGPNALVNEQFEAGAYQDEYSEEEIALGTHLDPEQEDEWEMQFEKQARRDLGVQQVNPAIEQDQYELTRETVTEELIETEYTIDISKVEAGDAFPAIAAMDATSIENVLNAAYQELEVEAGIGQSGLQISVKYDGHDTLVEGVTTVMDVYRSFDGILKSDEEQFETF